MAQTTNTLGLLFEPTRKNRVPDRTHINILISNMPAVKKKLKNISGNNEKFCIQSVNREILVESSGVM